MRYSQSACLISGLLIFVCGCHSRDSNIEAINTQSPRSSATNPDALLVSLPDPIFIVMNGRDSNGIIHISISDGGSFGMSGKPPYTMLTFSFVDSDKEKDIPPRIYIGGRFPAEAGVRMLSPHESEVVVKALRTFLESHHKNDELTSLLTEPELPIDSELRSEIPHCLIHIIHQHKSYALKANHGIERTR
ncbi:MAG: hypothetical protein ACYS6K_23535 [Planctomycetota bacterium]|jgi:hypothetical protein